MNIVTAKRQHSKSSSCVCSCKFASGSGSISYNSLVQPPSINSDYECHCKKIEAPIKVLVTGAAGQIAYILVGLLAKGNAFGSNQPIILHLLDIPQMEENLRGVAMELIDLASSILVDVIPTTDITVAFRDIDVAFLVGSMPRRVGMERRDLLAANVKIFKSQGSALEQYAKRTVKVLVVGNPANTNALMCSKYAPSIPKENFAAMTRLDHNRATSLIASRLRIPANCVRNVIIWGNHSTTQYPDVHHAVARIGDKDKPVYSAVVNDEYLQGEFITTVQKRGAAVISARKLSSAMSAANAATQCMHDWWLGTQSGTWVSMAVYSDGSYGAPSEVMYSFPVICESDHSWRIVQGLPIDDFSREKMDLSGKELLEERNEALMVCKD